MPLVRDDAEAGEIVTDVTAGPCGGAAVTVTVAKANLVASALLVAVTVAVPTVAGAVYAPEDVMRKLAYPNGKAKWFLAKNASVEDALQGIIGVIMQTVVTAGRTPSLGRATMVLQAPVPGSGINYGDPDEFV